MKDKATQGRTRLSGFLRDRRGATVIIFALAFIPVLGMIGGVIDFGRAYYVKARLQSALDAAVLATASSAGMSDNDRIAHGKQVFAANYPEAVIGVTAEPNITISGDGEIVGTVDADLGSMVLGLLGVDNLDIGAQSEVKSGTLNQGEVVLVLDYSGSMSSSGKYQSMRDAATELVNLLSQDGAQTGVKFGLVPFSEHVYGTIESDYIVNEPPGGSWTNCTRDRKWPHNTQDSTPIFGSNPTKWGLECSGGGEEEEDDEGEEGEGGGCNPYSICSNYPSRGLVVQPLTNDHGAITSQLNAMSPYANTHISLGMAIGWHLISPNPPWQEGVAYKTTDVLKAIVLLTDGHQTTAGWGPGTSRSVSNAETNLEDMCTAIKQQGVTIVTVAFDLDDEDTKTRLQSCASSPTHFFFDIDTGAQLLAAFQAIAAQFAKDMHLSK